MLIIFALVIVPVALVIGVVAVDASMWQSERRGAQKDADLSALAGAYELLDVQDGTTADQARAAADAFQDANDEAGNAEIADGDNLADILVDSTCFNSDVLDSVSLNVRHKSRTFFADAFGLSIAPDIGAHARACMGSPIEGTGLLPLGVQVRGVDSDCFQDDPANPTGPEVPVFGQYCQLAFAGSDLASGEGGFLKMFDDVGTACSDANTGGGQTLQNEIEQGGAPTTCYVAPPGTTSADCDGPPPASWPFPYVNYCVWPKTGTFSNPIQDAFTTMFEGEGECDAMFGTDANLYDDWLEVVSAVNGDPNPDPGTTTFAKRACDSPRLVSLVIIDQFQANGNDPAPILAFASFYIESCIMPDGTQYRTCDIQGGQIGQAKLYGFFMNILELGTIGASNKYGQRAISLWE